MNIFLHELKAFRKSTALWTISLAIVIIIYFSLFPSFSRDIEQMRSLLQGFPEAIRIGLGITLDSFANVLGYYSFPFSFIVLIGAIQAMNLGTSIVSKEIRGKTADFLLTKPIKRTQVLTSKIMAGVTSLVITNVIYIVVATITASTVKNDDFSFKIFFMISITLLFVQLIFMSLGVIVSVILPRIKSVLPISLATVFTFYFMSFLSSGDADDVIRYLTPFKYFRPDYIIENNGYDRISVIIALVFIVGSITASYVIYSKKDIHAV